LLCAGRIDPRKGIATAIRALAELPSEATLSVVGDGDPAELDRLRALALELSLGDRVSFETRPHEEMPDAYAAADCILFPVEWDEPWGLVPLEGMAVGRPVVATGAGGSAEYLVDGANCLLFDPGDARSLAAAVRCLAEDQALRDQLRAAGDETAARYGEAAFNQGVEDALRASAGT
jgi:glycosyltransferase involved in cell wall biosynthesis